MLDNKYMDIISLSHHTSKKHPRMSIEERSAQFAPFAALTGYEDDIKETGRNVGSKKELNEEQKNILDNKLKIIKDHIKDKPKISCIYFVPDLYKKGGKYKEYIGNVAKVDEYKKIIVFQDTKKICICDIIELEIF